MNFDERAVTIACGDECMVGILAVPTVPATRGVLIVVGGPQYRAGSHRQLVLLGRDLASAGIAAFRFDNRGMGDSDGAARTFEDIEEDLRVAIDAFCEHVPTLREVVIWGLCGAASAALLYGFRDARIHGLVLANPWVRTSAGLAQTMIRRHYIPRLLDPNLWQRVIRGRVNVRRSLADLLKTMFASRGRQDGGEPETFPLRMAEGLERFRGRVLVYLSGDDLTAKEFEEMCGRSAAWKRALGKSQLEWRKLPSANHTYSSRYWREQVHRWTIEWLHSW